MRKFGVEIEINKIDQNIVKNLFEKDDDFATMQYVCDKLNKSDIAIRLQKWHNCHNNKTWICKPDSSCGIEICSPVSQNFIEISKVIELLSKDSNIKVNDKCSFHVHIDVSDLSDYQLASVLCWWIKFEHVFLDAMPSSRKLNKYCQCIGMSDIFQHDEIIDIENIINKLGETKYFTCNTFHLCKKNRRSIEIRIADHTACLDADYAVNWISLMLQFVDVFSKRKIPDKLVWENPKKLNYYLFNNKNTNLRNWFYSRIIKNIKSDTKNWNKVFRKKSIFEFLDIFKDLQLDKYYFVIQSLLNK